jgi:hypothetical protein
MIVIVPQGPAHQRTVDEKRPFGVRRADDHNERKIWKEKSSKNILKCFRNCVVVLGLCDWGVTVVVKQVTTVLLKATHK